MKSLRYIYALLVAMLLGFFSFACSDDDTEQADGKASGGNLAVSEIEININAPDISVDLETRAGVDKANITEAKPENGGKFQNLIVVVVDKSNKVYGIVCEKWYDEEPSETVGVTNRLVRLTTSGITNANGKAYALGNVSAEAYNTISGYSIGDPKDIATMPELNKLLNATISADDLYNLNFTSKTGKYKINGSNITTCAGMPMNGTASAELDSNGRLVFNVKMKRVCARMHLRIINKTNYYYSQPNTIYVDAFSIKGILATSSKYFYDGSAPSKVATEDFDILKALGCTNNHIDNKVERPYWGSNELEVSMYVFESVNDNYTYDLKIDKGKSLGGNVKSFDTDNVYVICHSERERVLALNEKKELDLSVYTQGDGAPQFNFTDNILWQLELGSDNGNSNTGGNATYTLKYYPIDDKCLLKDDGNDLYFAKQKSSSSFNKQTVENPSPDDKKQYLWFETTGIHQYQINFCSDKKNGKWSTLYYYCFVVDNNNNMVNYRKGFSNDTKYDWTLYSKYIIRKGAPIKEDGILIERIARNHSYEFAYEVTTNGNEVDLFVRSVRDQKTMNWTETQK